MAGVNYMHVLSHCCALFFLPPICATESLPGLMRLRTGGGWVYTIHH